MKKLYTIIALLTITLMNINAQNSAKMTIHKSDKTEATYNLSDIDSITFTPCNVNCGELLLDSRDGQSYKTVLIGTQCWMAQNLNVGTQIYSTTQMTNNGEIEKYCYNDDPENCNIYGALYQWNEVMQYTTTDKTQGICPTGWHVASDGDWKQLEMALGMSQTDADISGAAMRGTIAGKFKTTGTIEGGTGLWKSPNLGATNESGFSALPSGNSYYTFGNYYVMGEQSEFWTSTMVDSTNAFGRDITYADPGIQRPPWHKDNGDAVRCVKN